ncbi:MAG: hypothetical protein GX569_01735 [Candidatus Riflebacteria bacterium]|nr:hypothetical protein [Candidatus Riflebacteria bacterium]
MRSLMEKFYAKSPGKRVFTIVAWLLVISLASTVYSFYNLATQLKAFNEASSFKETGFENIPASKGYAFIDEPLKNALAGWKALAGFSETVMIKSYGAQPNRLDEKVAEHDQEIITALKNFGTLDWKYLIIFASPQLDPLSDELAESFRKVRSVSRFIALYHRRYKQLYPEENSSFIFAAQVKLARLNDLTSPFLIGKMITVAIDGIAMRQITGLHNDGLLSDAETADCIDELKTSLATDKPMKTAMEDEFIFFKHAYGRLFSRAPLAMWILERYYGEPFDQYQKLSRETFDNPEFKFDMDLVSHNPVLMIAFPNFRKANFQAREKASQKSIMIATLEARLGLAGDTFDPWTGETLKSVKRENSTVFYSVGPNKVDDNASGDDILLPTNLEI